ncbi:putative rhodanese [Magnetofaba australis IT-1]|uniref:Putative rhodanese n=1 Tax=Magnetofaba australis IT-1 TaxID=1434232 RepID=A0A1Y2K7Q3_9PROT|nr:putative rhodanese [Magnetofaba australis IT-1]
MCGVALLLGGASAAQAASAKEAARELISDYLMEATHTAGMVTVEQARGDLRGALFVDMREAPQYQASHIEGAIHKEWREALEDMDEIPDDRMVILYCGTGALSAQAGFAMRMLGKRNVLILRGGYEDWVKAGAK